MNKKILSFACISVFLELYDFTLYAVLISYLAPLFFKFENPTHIVLVGYLTNAASFLFNPIGALYWGWLGDKYGRIIMLKRAMIFMAIPSLCIACLPTYESIGVMAPILLFSFRVMQNFSISGGNIGSKILAIENAGNNTGLIAGITSFSGGMGIVFASLSGYFITKYSHHTEYWRLPFLLGSIFMIIRVVITRNIFKSHNISIPTIKFSDLYYVIKDNTRSVLMVFLFGALISGVSYTISSFLHSYFIQLGYGRTTSYLFVAISTVMLGVSSVLTGAFIDRFNNIRKTLIASFVFLIVITFPAFILINMKNDISALIGMLMLGITHGAVCTACNLLMYRAFPSDSRCRGVTLCYSSGSAIFGGMSPFVMRAASAYHTFLPAVILVVFLSIILTIYIRYSNDSLYRHR